VTVNIARDGAQLSLLDGSDTSVTQLTFTPTNWDQWVTLKVKSVDDTVRENSKVSHIVHSFTSADAVYGQAADVEVDVRVLDNDSPNVLVTESDGGTFLVRGVSSDDYTLRLVSAPTAPVTVDIFGDGQTRVVSATRGGTNVLTTALVGGAVSVNVTKGTDTSAPAGARGTLARADGHSWLDDGFRVGTQFKIDGNATVYKINDIVDVVDAATNAVTSSKLILTLDGSLASIANGSHSFQRVAGAVVFDATNWWKDVTITVAADLNFVTDVSQQFVRNEPVRHHLTGEVSGPLIVEGGIAEGKDRSLRAAIMLPTESTAPPKGVSVDTDETKQADRLVVFNDSSAADDIGRLSEVSDADVTEMADIVILRDPMNLSGLGMRPGAGGLSTSLTVDISEAQDGSNLVTFPGGITFDDIEITEVLLGQGNDNFTVTATSRGTPVPTNPGGRNDNVVTVIHGGGNTLVGSVMGGDTIVVTGGGGPASPLVIYGDTSQDGARYDSRADLGIFTGNAFFFAGHGNDVIDAHLSPNPVVIYGGRGNDTIRGSQADDQIAGGSGDDTISGEGGNDQIYGDSGFNLDIRVTK